MSILVPQSDRRARAREIQLSWRGAGIPPRVEEYKEILAPGMFNDAMHHDSAAHVWSCGLTGLDIHVTNADVDVALDAHGLSFTAGGHQTGPHMNIGSESRWFHMQGGRLWCDGKPVMGWGDLDLLDLPWSIGGDLVAPSTGAESAPT